MPIYELAALAAALSWAFTGIISAGPSKTVGALAFSRMRMSIVFIMLAVWTSIAGSWSSVTGTALGPLIASGFIGIFLGDGALFLAMNRLGPRRTAMLFSLNAPISAILGYLALGETLSVKAIIGIAITFVGVVLAITYGKRKDQLHAWEAIIGPLWIGVVFGFIAALGQAVGALIVRPVMEAGADPAAASAIRVGTSALCFLLLVLLPIKAVQAQAKFTPKIVMLTALSGFLAMGLGMTLLLFGLSGGKVGIITTLSATTPAMLLPILWWRTKEMPAAAAWTGAILVIIGSAMIFNG